MPALRSAVTSQPVLGPIRCRRALPATCTTCRHHRAAALAASHNACRTQPVASHCAVTFATQGCRRALTACQRSEWRSWLVARRQA
jgi:hypothetical protein